MGVYLIYSDRTWFGFVRSSSIFLIGLVKLGFLLIVPVEGQDCIYCIYIIGLGR